MYPTTLPSYTPFTTPITLAAMGHTNRHKDMERDIVALATKVGVTGSAVPTTLDYLLAHLRTDFNSHAANTSNPHAVTKTQVGLGNADNTSDATKLAATLTAVYPVGSIYISTSSVNPGTTFGFGTWTAFAAGRTIIGVGTSDQAFAAAATGGESNHILNVNEIPSHNHDPFVSNANTGSIYDVRTSASGLGSSHSIGFVSATGTANSLEKTGSTGGGLGHNNLQPYIVVYMWQRTA